MRVVAGHNTGRGSEAISAGPAAQWGYRVFPATAPIAGDTMPPFSVEARDVNGNFVGTGSQLATVCHSANIGNGGICPNGGLLAVVSQLQR